MTSPDASHGEREFRHVCKSGTDIVPDMRMWTEYGCAMLFNQLIDRLFTSS